MLLLKQYFYDWVFFNRNILDCSTKELFLIKENCRDPRQYELCLQQSFIINSWWCICFIYSIKPFPDFEPFLSCSRLMLLAVGFGHAPFCFLVLPCAIAVLDPSIQGLLLDLWWRSGNLGFFLNFALDFVCALRNVSNSPLYTIAHLHTTSKDRWGSQQSHLRHISDCLPFSF